MNNHVELLEAKETLALSGRTAGTFVRQLGALQPILIPPLPAVTLGKRPGFQATVLDQKYWFAKLYELVSYQEISYSSHTSYPGFSWHFMKVFYGMYYGALLNYQKGSGAVPPLWGIHFDGPPPDGGKQVEPDSTTAVKYSVRTGATAHIQGDMPIALATAYKTWNADPKPKFEELRSDFIDKSESAFKAAQAGFYIEVNDKTFSPLRPEVGQLGGAIYQAALDIQPSLPVMFQWRRDAWKKASDSL